MSAVNYTIAYNRVLRDHSLSLTAKGLSLVIKSFIGLKDFTLTKRKIKKYCADSSYSIDKAWKELKKHGYLRHYYSMAKDGSFVHSYELVQNPEPERVASFNYVENLKTNSSNCICVDEDLEKGNFTKIPNEILRDNNISLPVKALYSLVKHLTLIPHFKLKPKGIMFFCIEKIKKFTTLWKKLKLSGLLKQHRYPTGTSNKFTYDYDLLQAPNQDTPYLTNHHANGSVSTTAQIKEYFKNLSQKAFSVVKKPFIRKASSVTQSYSSSINNTKQLIEYDKLSTQCSIPILDLIASAANDIINVDYIRIQNRKISKETDNQK